jgi:hypothetical protein
MGGLLRRDELRDFVARGAQVHPLKKSVPATEQHRHDGDVHLIDQARTKILPNGAGPAPDLHAFPSVALRAWSSAS